MIIFMIMIILWLFYYFYYILADDRSTWRALRPTAGYAQQWVSECMIAVA